MQAGGPSPSLHAALERWEARRPSAPFIVEAESARTISYAAFAQAVRALRLTFGDALDEAPRTIVLALPGGIPAALVWLAALTGGHRLLPCPPKAPEQERARLGQTQRPDVLVVALPEDAAAFGAPHALVLTLADLEALAGEPISAAGSVEVPLPAREGTVRLTTSGTTGEPKGVVLSARQIAWTADAVRTSHALTPEDRGLCVLPFFHINAPVVSLCATLLAGGTVVIAPRFSRRQFWGWVERERITWVSFVPTIVALLLTTERPAFLPGALRFVRTASAPLPVARHIAFEQRFGIPLIETYGLSEAASQVTANPLPPRRRKPGSVGLPVGVELRIFEPLESEDDRGLRPVTAGGVGGPCAGRASSPATRVVPARAASVAVGSGPATSAISTTMATSSSRGGYGRSSTGAARKWHRARSRSCCWLTPLSPTWRWSASRIRSMASASSRTSCPPERGTRGLRSACANIARAT